MNTFTGMYSENFLPVNRYGNPKLIKKNKNLKAILNKISPKTMSNTVDK